MGASEADTMMSEALQARRAGRASEARAMFEAIIDRNPDNAAALNSLGLLLLESGQAGEAITRFSRATEADPKAAPLWLNLAEACRAAGRIDEEIGALDRALAIDAYLLPAMLKKAQALERADRPEESADVYRNLLAASPDTPTLPEAIRSALAHGREVVRASDERRAARLEAPLRQVYEAYADSDLHRVRAYAEHSTGRRRIYQPKPTGGHFPFIPAPEYFDRSLFPWFDRLEAATDLIRRELLSIWAEDEAGFQPYVAFDPTQPVNQWVELNHSPRWSAWFFWRDGVRQDAHCARCPETAALLDSLPLIDIPGKAPSVMFSILAPKTRIPAHHGTTNVRVTVHLPLVVPAGCGFRVGGETREWREGEAWAFDDTIEHEAWNDSDRPRAILILDAWNPFLTEAERAAVRVIG